MAAGDMEQAVELQVRVADAQGLRLWRGGEIRLVITLRAADDLEGLAFGAKVTPWLTVPEGEAPQWRAREATFAVPADRSFQAEFVDTVHLHIELMQKGHTKPQEAAPKAPAAARTPALGALGWSAIANTGLTSALTSNGLTSALTNNGLTNALRQGTAAMPKWPIPIGSVVGEPSADRGELIGYLQLPVGKRLVVPGSGGTGDWVSLIDDGTGTGPDSHRVRGSLLLELATAHRGLGPGLSPPPPPPTHSVVVRGLGPFGSKATPPVSTGASSPPPSAGEVSDSEASDSASLSRASTSSVRGYDDEERWSMPALPPDLLSSQAVADLLAAGAARNAERGAPQTWRPFGAVARTPPSADLLDPAASLVNIFTINNPSSPSSPSSGAGRSGASGTAATLAGKVAGAAEGGGGVEEMAQSLRDMLWRWTQAPSVPSTKPLKQRLRSAFDPGVRQQRREVRRWRRWHEVFCVLNEIERQLGEALALLVQGSASMRRFGESYSQLPDISAFLRDAALYFRSEGEIPTRLEARLGELEHIADEFRSFSIESQSEAPPVAFDTEAPDRQAELRSACEDLQLDVAVLLESALMAAHQALAEYKKMHCRLQLVATEYEPICRLELDDAARPVSFLPLLADESAKASAAALPEQAVQWAVDFSQMVGGASQGLELRVRELERRRRRLGGCAEELRAALLRRAASGNPVADGGGG